MIGDREYLQSMTRIEAEASDTRRRNRSILLRIGSVNGMCRRDWRLMIRHSARVAVNILPRVLKQGGRSMITFLRGNLAEKQPMRIVLDVGGVGYEVFIPLSSYDRLPSVGGSVQLFTIDHVREDAHLLYGFITEAERSLFLLLTGVSGIGPKLAISALSGLSVRDLKAAVVEGNVKRISTISGIGAKMAERIVVELKHKLSAAESLSAVAGESVEANVALRDALMALVALGYKQDDARVMVMRVNEKHPEVSDVERIIKLALSK